ncbi:hypothetical protein L3Y25_gp083 [Gordonia phage Syleon]|uniref:Uncharacterized protein n=1 Tax=Gordonia phage Syleon TaxID=2653718 RepID=A0A5Q2WDH9_9CAUD|nr:hypothetical protein L3Y25_gp083 [Gordonia phage Syleon]QGH75812.1 hypothetical protein SEA_SYLEON_83 [Gordonia phage Syleon]
MSHPVLESLDFEARCECEWVRPGETKSRRCHYGSPDHLVTLVTIEKTVARRAVCGGCLERLEFAGRLVGTWSSSSSSVLSSA